uniref:Uncharacterized protein n=1 Tax=Anguilla anguilla TaxID=7936 RepID=A0A0E9R6E8_ANGAN
MLLLVCCAIVSSQIPCMYKFKKCIKFIHLSI